jgi:putative redox protein
MEMITRFPGGQRVDTSFGPYVVRMDQRPKAGGEGAFPTPFEMFLASFGACAGHFVLGFCRTRGLPTDDISVVQSLEVDPATHFVTTIRLEIHVPADFPEKYRGALIRAAEQCTVKKHLDAPPRIVLTTTVDEPVADRAEPPARFGT